MRFTEAPALLDYGFVNCSVYKDDFPEMAFEMIPVAGEGIPSSAEIYPKEKFSHTFTSEYDEGKIEKITCRALETR